MENKAKVTVVVGRFQAQYLHVGHQALLAEALSRSSKGVLIIVGSTGMNPTERDPLSYGERAEMIRQYLLPRAHLDDQKLCAIAELKDEAFSDKGWCSSLDKTINEYLEVWFDGAKTDEVLLMGSRDSFLSCYTGKFETREINAIGDYSATEVRNAVRPPVDRNDATWFRAGIIYAHKSKPFANVYPTVDAIVVSTYGTVLLGRKEGEEGWRMPGGFVDLKDGSLDRSVIREVKEECGDLELGKPEYYMSRVVNDIRYRGCRDQVMTTVFIVPYIFGSAQAGDDLEEVHWFSLSDIQEGKVSLVAGHDLILTQYANEKKPSIVDGLV